VCLIEQKPSPAIIILAFGLEGELDGVPAKLIGSSGLVIDGETRAMAIINMACRNDTPPDTPATPILIRKIAVPNT
jgi:hypothetical protein